MRDILGLYSDTAALSNAELKKLCAVSEVKFSLPFNHGRRARLAALSREPAARERLLEEWFEIIPLQVQQLLGSGKRTFQDLRRLPKGREQSDSEFAAGTPNKPLKRDWTLTTRRAVYLNVIELPNGKVEPYVGKAASLGNSKLGKAYRGFDGRGSTYLNLRATGELGGVKVVPHVQALMDPNNNMALRCLCVFDDDFPLMKISLFEDVSTIYLRAVKKDDGSHYSGRYTKELMRLVQYWQD